MNTRCSPLVPLFCWLLISMTTPVYSQEGEPVRVTIDDHTYPLYPGVLDDRPVVESPFVTKDGREVILVVMKDGTYAVVPVTVENGDPLVYSHRIDNLFGKDHQLHVDSGDFPTLARTGLHSEAELNGKEMITGFGVDLITYIGRRGRFSGAGFMADDEDILTVLINDNRIVRKLGFTHPSMAKPLFHVWNLILKEIELGRFVRYFDNIQHVIYNE